MIEKKQIQDDGKGNVYYRPEMVNPQAETNV